jgi:hypothetical protein
MRTTEDGEDEELGSDTTVGYVRKSGKHTRSSKKEALTQGRQWLE